MRIPPRFVTFQSTLSLRRATVRPDVYTVCRGHFNPRSPCGERHVSTCPAVPPVGISIHALLAESDFLARRSTSSEKPDFNPRSPCGERHWTSPGRSIHRDFNPRSPCGERRECRCRCCKNGSFQSTLSLRRATRCHAHTAAVCDISIHALLAESDASLNRLYCFGCLFQSTLSLRRATLVPVKDGVRVYISIHALLAESDCTCWLCVPA